MDAYKHLSSTTLMTERMPLEPALGVGAAAREPSPRKSGASEGFVNWAASRIVNGRTRTATVIDDAPSVPGIASGWNVLRRVDIDGGNSCYVDALQRTLCMFGASDISKGRVRCLSPLSCPCRSSCRLLSLLTAYDHHCLPMILGTRDSGRAKEPHERTVNKRSV